MFLCKGMVSLHDDRWFTKPWGASGGMPGERSRKILYRKRVGAWANGKGGRDAEGEKSKDSGETERIILPSKADNIRVEPGDCLEYITWGGGGLGDPLTRPAEKVALEVHRRLVTAKGARENHGVVVREDFSVDEAATERVRGRMRGARGDVVGGRAKRERESGGDEGKVLGGDDEGKEEGVRGKEGDKGAKVYNRGGGLDELVATCAQETGQQPPRPQWVEEPYGPHVALPYVKEWYVRMRERGYGGWDV